MLPSSNAHRALLCLFMLLSIGANAMHQRVAIIRNSDGYHVIHDGKDHAVKSYDADALLRKMNPMQFKGFINAGGSIRVNKLDNGDYVLRSFVPGKGGGVIGGWIGSVVGYGAVTAAGHGAIHLVALCTGPLYPVTASTLHKMLAIPIHQAATAAGVAVGLAAAVATGPV